MADGKPGGYMFGHGASLKDPYAAFELFHSRYSAALGSTAGSNRESFLRFDLSNVAVNTGQAVKLRLWGRLSDTTNNNLALGVFPVASTTWGETATWWAAARCVSRRCKDCGDKGRRRDHVRTARQISPPRDHPVGRA